MCVWVCVDCELAEFWNTDLEMTSLQEKYLTLF